MGFVAVVVVVVRAFCFVLVRFFAALNIMHRDGGGKKRKIQKYNSFAHAFTHFSLSKYLNVYLMPSTALGGSQFPRALRSHPPLKSQLTEPSRHRRGVALFERRQRVEEAETQKERRQFGECAGGE